MGFGSYAAEARPRQYIAVKVSEDEDEEEEDNENCIVVEMNDEGVGDGNVEGLDNGAVVDEVLDGARLGGGVVEMVQTQTPPALVTDVVGRGSASVARRPAAGSVSAAAPVPSNLVHHETDADAADRKSL